MGIIKGQNKKSEMMLLTVTGPEISAPVLNND